jgi:hypothetical protein
MPRRLKNAGEFYCSDCETKQNYCLEKDKFCLSAPPTLLRFFHGRHHGATGLEAKMYSVNFFNFGYSRKFPTLAEAIEAAKKAGFESSVTASGILYAVYSPITRLDLRAPASFTPAVRNSVARAIRRG